MITAGVDIGSSSSKVVLLEDGHRIVGKAIIPVGTGTSGPARAFEQALANANLQREDISYIIATGYGRYNFPDSDQQISEISCHARGVFEVVPGAQTVIDIGGQDAKAIRIGGNGNVVNFVMNDKCAAGTGRFLDVMSRVLEVDVSQLGELASESNNEVSISSTCTVFAESEVISQLARGALRQDVASGTIRSVVRRVAGLVNRVSPVEPIVMTGGVSLNPLVVRFMQDALKMTVSVAPGSQLTGALGAALIAWTMYSKQLAE
ncbi:MAG: acyl-CoA dehydratase activase [Candidatus Saccharibacteria bacterium]